jgi:hypothetical protein
MFNDEFISLEIEGAYAVWFRDSGKFLLLEEPAWYVVSSYSKGMQVQQIARNCMDRYGFPLDHCSKFVTDALDKIRSLKYDVPVQKKISGKDKLKLTAYKYDPIDERKYEIGNKTFSFSYQNKSTMECVHPILAHLEIKNNNVSDHLFELFETGENLIIRVDGKVTADFRIGESGYLKASALLQITGFLHAIDPDEWMMTVHASGVTDGKAAILFPAQAGCGKSTLAALLQIKGYTVISDDFITIDRHTKRVFSIPAAITIKEGSVPILAPYYPELAATRSEKAYTGKMVRYIPLLNNDRTMSSFPLKHLIFVNYSSEKKYSFEKVSKKDAIQALLPETWVNPKPGNIRSFFNWFNTIDFYRLTYQHQDDAFSTISRLFNS